MFSTFFAKRMFVYRISHSLLMTVTIQIWIHNGLRFFASREIGLCMRFGSTLGSMTFHVECPRRISSICNSSSNFPQWWRKKMLEPFRGCFTDFWNSCHWTNWKPSSKFGGNFQSGLQWVEPKKILSGSICLTTPKKSSTRLTFPDTEGVRIQFPLLPSGQ